MDKPTTDRTSSQKHERRGTSKESGNGIHSVPIFFHGSVIAMLILYGISPGSLSDDDERLLGALASLCGVAIGNAQRFERLLETDHQLRVDDRLSTLGAVGAEIAHEIRNPINIISLLLHSLREDRSLPPARERDLDIIIEKLQHMDRVVTRTLELARQREPHLEWVQVEDQLDNLMNFITHPASRQAVMLHRVGPAYPLPQILMDRTHLDQILLNLLLNALDAMPNGGILGVRTYIIQKRPQQDPNRPAQRGRPRKDQSLQPSAIGIAISDTGPGIPHDHIRDLFTPFSTSRPSGTGLGLFVAHKLVHLHGGTIEVKSGPEAGTTFFIEFPVPTKASPGGQP
jgi:signal transduction histidine kinase